jgi:hydrogenase maturation protease
MKITVLGVGNILFTDEGIGIRVAEHLSATYRFNDAVSIVDGGTLGLNLLGIISGSDHLIVIDAVRNGGTPGTLYRLSGSEIPKRAFPKNSLHQVDLLEALTLCQVLDKVPEIVILGVEPQDIDTFGIELSPLIKARLQDLADMVLEELRTLEIDTERIGGA